MRTVLEHCAGAGSVMSWCPKILLMGFAFSRCVNATMVLEALFNFCSRGGRAFNCGGGGGRRCSPPARPPPLQKGSNDAPPKPYRDCPPGPGASARGVANTHRMYRQAGPPAPAVPVSRWRFGGANPPPPPHRTPDCGVHYLWFAFVCFLIRSHPPPNKCVKPDVLTGRCGAGPTPPPSVSG